MANYFFDTSAIVKHYNPELGSSRVDALLAEVGSAHAISRLAIVEFHSAFARKVRTGRLTPEEFAITTRLFRADVSAKRFRIVGLRVAAYDSAVKLIRRIGPLQNLRTLDALQLAVALELNGRGVPVEFVCADQALCTIASAEGLMAINPEIESR